MPATVMVIDDDPSIVNLLKEDLESEGYTVIGGYDGQMAIQMAKSQKPDLIIMDVNMPMTNGLQAIGFLRGLADTRDIPVIFLTGEASSNVYPLIQNMPRTAHLKKPIDLDHLNSMVRQFINQYRRSF